jgi:uncharacterized protein YndB with AHSA1/START domain
MTKRTVTHATFTIERKYGASPTQVFAAWSNPEAKKRWFACHDDWVPDKYELDFRVGGREHLTTVPPGEVPHVFNATYFDIVPNERIVYAYDMHLGERQISVSLATIEFKPSGRGKDPGATLVFTEQAAFLDGYDAPAEREEGTRVGLDNLDKYLRRQAAS